MRERKKKAQNSKFFQAMNICERESEKEGFDIIKKCFNKNTNDIILERNNEKEEVSE